MKDAREKEKTVQKAKKKKKVIAAEPIYIESKGQVCPEPEAGVL